MKKRKPSHTFEKFPAAFGPFEVKRLLGAGGMGEVYSRDSAGRDVALKILLEKYVDREEVRRRFEQEARLGIGLRHGNVVGIYEKGAIDEKPFVSFELVTGGSLADLLSREGALGEARALAIFRNVVSGLKAIEEAGLVHRDVKPANILMNGSGEALIADLGLARPTSVARTQFTATGVLIGTPAYISPEQIRADRDLDIRTDLYSAGCTFFECLCGRPPFQSNTLADLLRLHVEGAIPDAGELVPNLRPGVAELITDLLQKDRESRPRGAAAVLERLDALMPTPATVVDIGSVATADPRTALAETVDARAVAGLRPAGPPGLDRAALVVSARGREHTLFVYAGTQLTMGRNGLQIEGQDVCLRLRPTTKATESISGKHLRLTVADGRASVTDLGSAAGTWLDGRRLAPNHAHALPARGSLVVAAVLELAASVVPQPPGRWPDGAELELADANAPAVVIERPANWTEHRYALVPGVWGSGAVTTGQLAPGVAGQTELFASKGALWIRGRGVPPGLALPLTNGATLGIGGFAVHVRAIRPEDQK